MMIIPNRASFLALAALVSGPAWAGDLYDSATLKAKPDQVSVHFYPGQAKGCFQMGAYLGASTPKPKLPACCLVLAPGIGAPQDIGQQYDFKYPNIDAKCQKTPVFDGTQTFRSGLGKLVEEGGPALVKLAGAVVIPGAVGTLATNVLAAGATRATRAASHKIVGDDGDDKILHTKDVSTCSSVEFTFQLAKAPEDGAIQFMKCRVPVKITKNQFRYEDYEGPKLFTPIFGKAAELVFNQKAQLSVSARIEGSNPSAHKLPKQEDEDGWTTNEAKSNEPKSGSNASENGDDE
jgi:hypothetical protein